MIYRTHLPAPPLARFVDYLWYLSDAPTHARERIVPSGTLELVINLHEDKFRIYEPAHPDRCRTLPGAMVSGAYGGSFGIDTREHASIIGVHFKPGRAAPILGVPAGELTDLHVDLGTLWGSLAAELRERLCEAASPDVRFRILEAALAARLSSSDPLPDAMGVAVECLDHAGVGVREVATHLHFSHRRFIEVFTAGVGLTPKVFARVRRFQRAMSQAMREPVPDWAMLALDCGYYDQSHMNRDFVEFSGFPPQSLLRHRRTPAKDYHVALA